MQKNSTSEFRGQCLCGELRFSLHKTPTSSCWCHCRSCRLAAGASPVAWVSFPSEALQLESGSILWIASSAQAERGRCSRCSSPLFYRNDSYDDEIDVVLASLEYQEILSPTHHIWTEDQAAWSQISDNLPQHQKLRPYS